MNSPIRKVAENAVRGLAAFALSLTVMLGVSLTANADEEDAKRLLKSMSDYMAEVALICEKEHVDLGLYTMKDLAAQDPEEPLWKTYMVHGITHSLGLDVHDPFDRSIAFAPGMVLTCEPAIYLPGEHLGIRLENDILITVDGPVDLMEGIPLEPEEIEHLMRTSYT